MTGACAMLSFDEQPFRAVAPMGAQNMPLWRRDVPAPFAAVRAGLPGEGVPEPIKATR